jgi:hypothetical protein
MAISTQFEKERKRRIVAGGRIQGKAQAAIAREAGCSILLAALACLSETNLGRIVVGRLAVEEYTEHERPVPSEPRANTERPTVSD